MKTVRKYITGLLCLCMTCYTFPAFASNSQQSVDNDVSIIELSDTEMSALIGANGSVDANVVDYRYLGPHYQAKASFVNRSTLYCSYTLNATDINGNVLEVLEMGQVAPGGAIVAVGTPTVPDVYAIVGQIWNSGVPGLMSKDFSIPN